MLSKLLSLVGHADTAHAQLSEVAEFVSSGLRFEFGQYGGANSYLGIADFLLTRAWTVVAAFALLLLVRSGLKLIYGASEDKFEEAKRAIANGLMAVVLTFLTGQMVAAFIRVGGTGSEGAAFAGAGIFHGEMMGIFRWVSTLLVVLAIAMIIASVFTGMLSMGGDDALPKMKRAIFGAAAGIIIVIFNFVFLATFDLGYLEPADEGNRPNPFAIINGGLNLIAAILMFLALIAVIVVIYAGIMMILSLGNEDQFKKQRSLILRALLGLFVILVSFVIVQFVVQAFSG